MNKIDEAIKILKSVKTHQTRLAKKVGAYDMNGYIGTMECVNALETAILALEEKKERDFLSRVEDMCNGCGKCKGGVYDKNRT